VALLSRGPQAALDERRHEAATIGGVGVQNTAPSATALRA